MDLLKEKILSDAKIVGDDILKVDKFLNHQMDIKLINEIGKEFKSRFQDLEIDKILTIEASGIAIATVTSQYFDFVPVVFAKKTESINLDKEVYECNVFSFTKKKNYKVRVGKDFIKKGERVLIIDDFLAQGCSVKGLIQLVKEADAKVCGVGIVIEKGFNNGRANIEKLGVKVESLATVDQFKDGQISFK